MSDWKAKRFWKDATVVETDGGFTVELDGRGDQDTGEAFAGGPDPRHGREGR